MIDNNEAFMTRKDVCRYCGFSMSVLNKLEKDGILKPKRKLPINHRRLYRKIDVDNFLSSITNSK